MTKRCSHCKKALPLVDFCKNKSTKSGLAYWCRDCCAVYAKSGSSKRSRKISRRKGLLKQYNLTIDDYNRIFQEQEGRCLLCNKHQSKLDRKLDVDHSHKTGRVRGLICMQCNVFLGHLEKNRALLNRALKYLS